MISARRTCGRVALRRKPRNREFSSWSADKHPQNGDKSSLRQAMATQLVSTAGYNDPTGSATVPIFQTATFDCRNQDTFDYTRSGNPTRHALEELGRRIEHGSSAYAFSTGMAALSAVLRSMLRPGDTVVACKDIYGGMHRLLHHAQEHSGIHVRFVETWELDMVRDIFSSLERQGAHVAMVCMESPTNPQMRVSDIRAISRIARASNAYLCIDSSIMSPMLCQPLELGADIVVHSATKFISGHSDTMAGLVVCKDEEVGRKIAFTQNAEGTGLSPFDAWLVLRGAKTMALRVAAAQANASEIDAYLCSHPYVKGVNYLSLPEERSPLSKDIDEKRSWNNAQWKEEAKLHFSQARGGGAVLSFEMETPEISQALVQHCKIFKNTVSFGSTSSLIERPCVMSHASIPVEQQTMSPALLRLSLGIEHSGDLLHDLGQAISKALSESKVSGAISTGTREVPDTPAPAAVAEDDVDEEWLRFHIRRPSAATSQPASPPLGQSLPPMDEHAVGVSMPKWEDVIKYEEGDEATHAKLSGGYPRFVFLRSVRLLFEKAASLFASDGEMAMAVPSARVALRFQKFLASQTGGYMCGVHDLFAHSVFAVTFPEDHAAIAKKFWQHSGEIVSSRQAAAALELIDRTCYENAESGEGIGARKDAEKRPTAKPLPRDGVTPLEATAVARETARQEVQQSRLKMPADNSPVDPLVSELAAAADAPFGGGNIDSETASPYLSNVQQPRDAPGRAVDTREDLRRRISSLLQEDARNVFLYPTGMAAIAASQRVLKLASQWEERPLRTVVFGFSYLDTLKLAALPPLGTGVAFFGRGDDQDFADLRALLELERIGGLYCEFPSNPLLRAPDLRRLRALADEFDFPIVVDDSIAGYCNVDLLGEGGADIVCTSLTKQFSGSGNVMGGSAVLNSHGAHFDRLRARLVRDYEPELLWEEDATVLLRASMDLEHRVARCNDSCKAVVDRLLESPLVDKIHHPSLESSARDLYDPWLRDVEYAGYGALFSLQFHDPEYSQTFYDGLDVAKGPGFGTNFTLACPYTVIAHYEELDWASEYGVDPSLVRIWIGQEDRRELEAKFEMALDTVNRK